MSSVFDVTRQRARSSKKKGMQVFRLQWAAEGLGGGWGQTHNDPPPADFLPRKSSPEGATWARPGTLSVPRQWDKADPPSRVFTSNLFYHHPPLLVQAPSEDTELSLRMQLSGLPRNEDPALDTWFSFRQGRQEASGSHPASGLQAWAGSWTRVGKAARFL